MKKKEETNSNDIEFEKLFSSVVFKEEEFANKDIVGNAIMVRIKTSRKRFQYTWAAASVILILLSSTAYITSNRKFSSGESTLTISLPDGSQVQMLEKSQLSYNSIAWFWNRTVNFKGLARFTVSKGKQFVVKTDFGNVEVLGTEFQVETEIRSLTVECFSGIVGVKTDVGDQILHSSEKVKCSPEGIVFTPAAKPLPDFLEFAHVPLTHVVYKMEELFNVTIEPKNICLDIIYDGLLPTGNLGEALEIVMSSCGITYSINGTQITISRYVKE